MNNNEGITMDWVGLPDQKILLEQEIISKLQLLMTDLFHYQHKKFAKNQDGYCKAKAEMEEAVNRLLTILYE
jgi:hypothetical protein